MVRMLVPASSRWVAKLCRRVWTVTCLPRPAASRAALHAMCTGVDVIGRSGIWPGKSQGWSEAPAVAEPSSTRGGGRATEARA